MGSPLLVVAVLVGWVMAGAASAAPAEVDLSGAPIVSGGRPQPLETLAARELQRYLYRISGKRSRVTAATPGRGTAILVGTPESHRGIAALAREDALGLTDEAVGPEGFVLRALPGKAPRLVVAALQPVGVLHGVYALVERLGVGFTLGGDVFAGAGPARVPADLNVISRPLFAVRGSLPWYNFLDSPTTWDRDDYRFFFDQMAKMRMNFVGFHSYNYEPFCAYEQNGKPVWGLPLVTARNYGWGAIRGMGTQEFGFGTGDFFFGPEFGSRAITEVKDPDESIRKAQALLAEGLSYARGRGLKVCVGFEVDGDPTVPENQERLAARLEGLMKAYPMLDTVWLWQAEGRGGGAETADRGSQLDLMVERYGPEFQYLGNAGRVHEAVRVMLHMRLAHSLLKRLAPGVRMAVSGWGGDKWMRFSDFYRGLDRTLPKDVVFAALDNIDPSAAPTVSEVYGQISPERERWPIPWWESDGGGSRRDQWGPQCNVRPFTALCADALAKKCQGLLAIHWRTRDVEEVASYMAQFAWDPSLTYERFYQEWARRCYGKPWAAEMARAHQELEALGPRYTGNSGQVECGRFDWFPDTKLPLPENLRKLSEVRARVAAVREGMLREKAPAGLERVDWLLTTIDWLTRYDAAATVLRAGGEMDQALAKAEEALARGDREGAAVSGRQAGDLVRQCGLAEALQTYPWKMSTCGEWGTLATINVKAYAMYEGIAGRIRAVGGDPGQDPRTLPEPADGPRIVMRIPPSITVPGEAVPISAIVVGKEPRVTVRYRRPGETRWRSAPMRDTYHSAWAGEIPKGFVKSDGVEYYLEATDALGMSAVAPVGAPAVTWSATGCALPAGPAHGTPAQLPPATIAGLRADAGADYEVRLRWAQPDGAPACRVTRRAEGEADVVTRVRLADVCDALVNAGVTYTYTVVALDEKGQPGPEATATVTVPKGAPPAAVEGITARPGPTKVALSWRAAPGRVRGYRVYRSRSADDPGRPVSTRLVPTETLIDGRLDPSLEYFYRVCAVDRGGQEGALSTPVAARPLPRVAGPVFEAEMESLDDVTRAGGQRVGGASFSPGRAGNALDTSPGGYVTYPHQAAFTLDGEFTLEMWVKPQTLAGMPVVASCGEWQKNGWFLQLFGHAVRFSLGNGHVLDAGKAEAGKWTHLVCTYDLQTMRLYVDGKEAGSREAPDVDLTPWPGPLFVSQYHLLEEPYQYRGLLDGLRFYKAALTPEEVARRFASAP